MHAINRPKQLMQKHDESGAVRHGAIIDSRRSILSTQTLSSTQHKGTKRNETKRNESSPRAYCNEMYHFMSSTLTAMTSTPTAARSDPERRHRLRRDCLGARRPRETRPPTPPTSPQTRTRTTQTTKTPIREYHATQRRQRHHSPRMRDAAHAAHPVPRPDGARTRAHDYESHRQRVRDDARAMHPSDGGVIHASFIDAHG